MQGEGMFTPVQGHRADRKPGKRALRHVSLQLARRAGDENPRQPAARSTLACKPFLCSSPLETRA